MTRSYPHLIQENLQLRLSPRVATPQDPLSSMDQLRLRNGSRIITAVGSSEFSAQLPRSWKRKPMGPLKWLGWWLVQGAALVLSSLKRQSHQTYEHHLKLETNLCYANSIYRWLEWRLKSLNANSTNGTPLTLTSAFSLAFLVSPVSLASACDSDCLPEILCWRQVRPLPQGSPCSVVLPFLCKGPYVLGIV